MTTNSFVDLNNTSFHYQVQGDGPALVLIHAGIADLRMWEDQLDAFGRQFTVIRYDVRGWGRTPCPPGSYSDHEDLRDLLAYLGVDRTHLLGCSNGGRIALDFSLTFPELVDRLVLVGTAVGGYAFTDPATEEKSQAMEAAYEAGDIPLAVELDAQLWVDGLYRRPDQVDPDVRGRAVAMLRDVFALPDDDGNAHPLDPPAVGRLGEIRSPTLVLIGELDTPDMLQIADLLVDQIPDTRLRTLPGVAHLPNMEQPVTFNKVVLDFLSV